MEEAQAWKEYLIQGRKVRRVRFGEEEAPVSDRECPWCKVKKGNFHMLGCPEETCGHCGERAIDCEAEALLDPISKAG